MIMGMSEKDTAAFLERISATTIVNQAVLKCGIAGMDVTPDNVVLFIGDFLDPAQPNFKGLIAQIDRSLDEMFSVAWQHDAINTSAFQRKN